MSLALFGVGSSVRLRPLIVAITCREKKRKPNESAKLDSSQLRSQSGIEDKV